MKLKLKKIFFYFSYLFYKFGIFIKQNKALNIEFANLAIDNQSTLWAQSEQKFNSAKNNQC